MNKALRNEIIKKVLIRNIGQFKDRSLSRAEHLQSIRYPASRVSMADQGRVKK